MYIREENNYPKAIMISTGIMGILIAISFFFVISRFQPDEEFGMGGMVVNYGTVEVGMGSDFLSIEDPSVAPNANGELPDKITLEDQVSQAKSAQDAKNLATQDVETSVALNAKSSNTISANSNNKTTQTEQINQQALYKGNKSAGTGRGDGTGDVAGNQGSVLGDPMAPNYGEGGSGFGDTPIDLGKFSNLVKPEDNTQKRGRVAVKITIDKNGKIIRAEQSLKHSNTTDTELVRKSVNAMLGARYNGADIPSGGRTGIVVFNYGLN